MQKMSPQTTDAHILFDEGAQRSFITENLARELNITKTKRESIQLSAFGDTGKNVRNLETTTVFLQLSNGEYIPISVLIVPDIAVPMQNYMTKNITTLPYLKGLKLAHPLTTDDKFQISLLIGADFYWEKVGNNVIRGNGPTAVSSKLGYLLSGPINNSRASSESSVYLNIISQSSIEDGNITNFWRLESLGINSNETDEDLEYLRTYQLNSVKYGKGHYIAKLPWKQDHVDLPTNFTIAKARTESTIRRLSREPKLLQTYSDLINEQEKRGFIERVNMNEDNSKVHYIPHHAVKKDSITTPIRIVYDCSCRQSSTTASLNDCLMSTPPVTNDITKILMKFRLNKYAVSADIEKAFLHIQLDENDRDFTRFFWLSDPKNPTSELTTYRFKSILFGATCSPFILNATLLKHLDTANTPTALRIKEDLYVDNILSSLRSEEELEKHFKESRLLMFNAGFNLQSWASNSSLLKKMAINENVMDKDLKTKVLGLRWDTENDKLSFAEAKIDTPLEHITKREILRRSSRIYDPLGSLGPVTIRAKVLIQELWKRKIGWDIPVSDDIESIWTELVKDLQISTSLELNRRYFSDTSDQNYDHELHVFVDASLTAYGAVAYICNKHSTSFIMAKNRVAPMKALTLPQLELMAALIGARLATHITATLKLQNVVFWCDSQIVLHWLCTTKQLKRFVRNRIEEIKSLTKANQWRYCPTSDNPADLQTRGIAATQLSHNQLWFNGPEWLLNKEKWPVWNRKESMTLLCTNVDDEKESAREFEKCKVADIESVIDITLFSSYQILIRVTAYVIRFIRNCQLPKFKRQSEALTSDEIHNATELWILNCQKKCFSNEMENLKSNTERRCTLVKQLRLYLDSNGLLRCGGKIHNAPLAESTKFPYLLPKTHLLTRLIIMDAHMTLKHAGMLSTVTYLRQTFWIPCIRQCVRKVLHQCLVCRKYDGKSYPAPDPPPLPKNRLTEAPPFTITGVDFTGALYVKDIKGIEKKVYVCLFTCANTRAVHLEIVSDLSEEAFLLAFRRFSSRKSLPRIMISDNGSTYLAASGTIKRLTSSTKVRNSLSKSGTTWQFIPKRAPWYGGFWERLIGVTKSCLRKTIGRAYLSLVMLQTIIVEIEAIVNDRPLTYISSSFTDEEPLTPSHLLYGRRIMSTPYPAPDFHKNIRSDKIEICKRAQTQKLIIDHFWKRWNMEYLTSLREFHRTTGDNKRIVNIGDVVHIEEDKPRNEWKLAFVEDIIIGNDGHVRAALVKTNTGLTTRPIVKLYPVEVHASNASQCSRTEEGTSTDDSKIRILPRREASIRAKENIQKWTL